MSDNEMKLALEAAMQRVRELGWTAITALHQAAKDHGLDINHVVDAWNEREIDWEREADFLADLAHSRGKQLQEARRRLSIAAEALRFCADEYADDLAIAALAEIAPMRSEEQQ